MSAALFYLVAGIVLLALGGDSLVKSAAGLARRTGISPFTLGLVMVAFATSIPEIAVNLRAMAVGDRAPDHGRADETGRARDDHRVRVLVHGLLPAS